MANLSENTLRVSYKNATYALAFVDSGVGQYLGLWKLQADGNWLGALAGNTWLAGPYYSPSEFINAVNAAGGPVEFIKKILEYINQILKQFFGSTATPPTGPYVPPTLTDLNVKDVMNETLARLFEGYSDANGVLQFRIKA